MIGKRALSWIGIIGLIAMFTSVFLQVLKMRIAKGDIYEHYATFRTDPLGSSGLFESFQKMPGYSVGRNMQSLVRIDTLDEDTALFLLGIPQMQYRKLRVPDEHALFDAVKQNGARLIITLDPQYVPTEQTTAEGESEWIRDLERILNEDEDSKKEVEEPEQVKSSEGEDPFKNPGSEKKGDQKEEEKKSIEKGDEKNKDGEKKDDAAKEIFSQFTEGTLLSSKIGVKLAKVGKFKRPEAGWELTRGESLDAAGAPKLFPDWKSQYRFEIPSSAEDDWKIVASVDEKPVVVERKYGKGTIVVTTDSFFASNESLYTAPASEFLLWLTGGKTKLLFDETLHGSVESTGAMQMIRHYRLHGFLLGLVAFVILWAWRSASSLAPGDEATERGLVGSGGMVSGKDSKSGLINLLRRSIPRPSLIESCLATWKSSQVNDLEEDKSQQIAQVLSRHKTNPKEHGALDTYKQIAQILRKR